MDGEKSSILSLKKPYEKLGKLQRIIIIAGIVGILLIWLSSFLPERKGTSTAKEKSKTADEFIADTEQKLVDIIGSIEGAGKCRVMVTLENGVEYIYAVEQDINSSEEDSIAYSATIQRSRL